MKTPIMEIKAAAVRLRYQAGEQGTNDGEHDAALGLLSALDGLLKCCHAGDPLLCSHPCAVCRADEARQIAASIRAFDRQCKRDEETDTGRAWELLTEARKLLTKIGKEAA